eukprot:GHRR01015206.1.p2 GENE.GHRR01015206.1~~GHRR01015206.1.p2  ORF type:complete len:115 (-),score=34.44 GHRR01015206.1:672-1016(-)
MQGKCSQQIVSQQWEYSLGLPSQCQNQLCPAEQAGTMATGHQSQTSIPKQRKIEATLVNLQNERLPLPEHAAAAAAVEVVPAEVILKSASCAAPVVPSCTADTLWCCCHHCCGA